MPKQGTFVELVKFIKQAGWDSPLPDSFTILYWEDEELISVDGQEDLDEAWRFKLDKKLKFCVHTL